MKTFLNLLNAAQYLPLVLTGVAAVEATIKGEAAGTTKKQVVLDAIQAAAKVGEGASEVDVNLISTLIDTTVARFNASGIFQKSAPATPAPAVSSIPAAQ